MVTISVNKTELLTLDISIEQISKEKEEEISNIIYPYIFSLSKPETILEIKNKIIKILVREYRLEKLNKINELKG